MLRQHATYRITRGGVMTCYRFSRWRPLWRNFTFGLGLGDVTFFRRSVSISIPNFCRHISNHGWDITSSVLEKTSTILEFYFRFRFRLHHRSRHAILHQASEFHSNRTTYYENMTCRFFKMATAAAQYYFRFPFVDVTVFRRSANQISSTYLNSWLRYNYFCFGKTNVRHIEILLPVWISTISRL